MPNLKPRTRHSKKTNIAMQIQQTEILLRDLRFYAYHGVLPQERTVGGHFTLNLTLRLTDATSALFDDRLEGTVSYAEVYALVAREMAKSSALLEHVAGRIAQALFDAFPLIAHLTLTLQKDTPPMGADCAGCAVRIAVAR